MGSHPPHGTDPGIHAGVMAEGSPTVTLDVARLRSDTPGVDTVIHLNAAGAALMPRAVVQTVAAHLLREAQIGGYEAAEEAAGRLDQVYRSIGRLINARPDEIAIVENATRAWDMAFYSLPLKQGDVVLTSTTEYASNYIAYLQLKRLRGIHVEVIPNDEHGQVSIAALRRMLEAPNVRLISLPMIATNGGPVQPVEAIGAAAREAGVWFLLDGCQAAGHVPLDVQRIGCHMLSATSRKYLRGPRGVGFLFVQGELCRLIEPAFIDLHAATLVSADRYEIQEGARRFENWESNIAATLGMGAAVEYALALAPERIWQRIGRLADYLRRRLSTITGVSLRDSGAVKSGIVTFTLESLEPAAVKQALSAQVPRINVTTSSSRATMLDMQARGLSAVVRASVHVYNTEAELDRVVEVVSTLSNRPVSQIHLCHAEG